MVTGVAEFVHQRACLLIHRSYVTCPPAKRYKKVTRRNSSRDPACCPLAGTEAVPENRVVEYITPLNIEAARLNEVTFYCRSRGIGLAEAAVMALGSLEEPVGWFEPHPDLAPAMEAMAKRVNTSLAQHIRENSRVGVEAST